MQDKQEIITKLKEIQPSLTKALKELIAIPSVFGDKSEDAPFGPGPKAALLKALDIADRLGFKTVNLDNKVGYAQYGDDLPTGCYYGIFGHVDVVEAGQGWDSDPWILSEQGNRLYGRGVLDNKGPILANLFALYVLKEAGIRFPYPVRIVFGTNEEIAFACVKHYLTKEVPPIFGWTPDCKWPVVYGERGRLRVRLTSPGDQVAALYRFANDYLLHSKGNGQELGITFSDEDFGEMIVRGYSLGMAESDHYIEWTMSYPASCSQEDLILAIHDKIPHGLTLSVRDQWEPVLYDKDSIYVQTLQAVYNQVTGNTATPVTTTGGTFAKIVPNIIAYGPSFPGQKDIAHLPNEWLDKTDLETNTIIYGLALLALSQLE